MKTINRLHAISWRQRSSEGGFMIVMSLLILFTLTLIGLTSILNANIESHVSANEYKATQALYAADAGLNHALAAINGDATIKGYIDNNANWDNSWSYPSAGSDPVSGGFDNDSIYQWRASFKQDIEDIDDVDGDGVPEGDGNTTELIYYNKNFFPADPNCRFNAGEGYPVVLVTSVGYVGGTAIGTRKSIRTVALELGKNKLDVKASGAVTAGSNIATGGNIVIDGRSHDSNGDLGGTCTSAKAGINVPQDCYDKNGDGDFTQLPCTDHNSDGDTNDFGECTFDTDECYEVDLHKPENTWGTCPEYGATEDCDWSGNTTGAIIPNSPEEALGLCSFVEVNSGTCTALASIQPAAGGSNTSGNIHYINADFDMNDGLADGVYIIHNPLFNALHWAWSRPDGLHYADTANRIHEGATKNYDCRLDPNAAADAWCATNGIAYDAGFLTLATPRKTSMNANDTFKGVVVADYVDKVNGNGKLIGALISLTTVEFSNVLGNGSMEILYSCDAINVITTQNYTTKLVWRRL